MNNLNYKISSSFKQFSTTTIITPMRKIMIVVCVFGIFIGVIFPIYAGFFVEWIPEKRLAFNIGCLVAGYIVGMFSYQIIKITLKRIDSYYKKTLITNLGISSVNESTKKKDLLIEMQQEFEQLIHSFSALAKKENERLKTLSITDSLTTLYNHRHFYECISRKQSKGCKILSVLFCDIDYFKLINDKYGHTTGDIILGEVANIIKVTTEKNGTVFRYGGEEFVVLLEDHTSEQAYKLAEKIRLRISNSRTIQKCSNHILTTISIGIASYPEHSQSIESLIDKADKAMYSAKYNGRNQCCIYTPDIQNICEKDTTEILRREMLDNSVSSLTAAIDAKDTYTERHSESVAKFALQIAERIGMSEKEKYALKIGGLLHDCGKIGIPDEIINKPGPLTDEEWKTVKNHTLLGSNIIKYIIKTPEIENCIRYHHERWDGTGYPDGLSGESIPLYARIICIADAYHAMISDRSYRRSLSKTQVFEELRKNSGTQFDPVLVEIFIKLHEEEIQAAENESA